MINSKNEITGANTHALVWFNGAEELSNLRFETINQDLDLSKLPSTQVYIVPYSDFDTTHLYVDFKEFKNKDYPCFVNKDHFAKYFNKHYGNKFNFVFDYDIANSHTIVCDNGNKFTQYEIEDLTQKVYDTIPTDTTYYLIPTSKLTLFKTLVEEYGHDKKALQIEIERQIKPNHTFTTKADLTEYLNNKYDLNLNAEKKDPEIEDDEPETEFFDAESEIDEIDNQDEEASLEENDISDELMGKFVEYEQIKNNTSIGFVKRTAKLLNVLSDIENIFKRIDYSKLSGKEVELVQMYQDYFNVLKDKRTQTIEEGKQVYDKMLKSDSISKTKTNIGLDKSL